MLNAKLLGGCGEFPLPEVVVGDPPRFLGGSFRFLMATRSVEFGSALGVAITDLAKLGAFGELCGSLLGFGVELLSRSDTVTVSVGVGEDLGDTSVNTDRSATVCGSGLGDRVLLKRSVNTPAFPVVDQFDSGCRN
jgi:hypothetical protein